jgi:hypothetical protein
MEAIFSSEKPVDFRQTIWRYIPEDETLSNHSCENIDSYLMYIDYQKTIREI